MFQKFPQHKKNNKMTDAPNGDAKIAAHDDDADSPNTTDNDYGSTNSKNIYIHWETAIVSPVLLLMMLPPPMMLPLPTLS